MDTKGKEGGGRGEELGNGIVPLINSCKLQRK